MVQYDMMLTAKDEDGFTKIIHILNNWDGININICEQKTTCVIIDRKSLYIEVFGGGEYKGEESRQDFLAFYGEINPYIRTIKVTIDMGNGLELIHESTNGGIWHEYEWIMGEYRDFRRLKVKSGGYTL